MTAPRLLLVSAGVPLGLGALGVVIVALAVLGVSSLLVLGLVAAVAAVPFVAARPQAALAVLVAVEVSNAAAVLGEHGVPGVYIAAFALAVYALVAGVIRGSVRLAWSPLYLAAAVFLAARALSLLVAEDQALALSAVADDAKSLLFLLVVVPLASSPKGVRTLATTAVLVAAALAGLSLVQEFALGNAISLGGFSKVPKELDLGGVTARHSGPEDDANFWARNLVLFVPVAASCLAALDLRRRWVWLAATLVLLAGIYLTQSRGGFISVALAIVAWLALAGRRYRRFLVLAPIVVLVGLLIPGLGSRLGTLYDLGEAPGEEGDPSLVGRLAVQKLGLAMFLDHPATGVGAGNFEVVEPEYQRRSGQFFTRVLGPHNIYLEMAAEGGIGGLASWLLFYATAMFVALRAVLARPPPAHGSDRSLERLLAVGVLAGLGGWAVASVFLHLAEFRVLLVVMALGAALDIVATRSATGRGEPAVPVAAAGVA